MAWSLPRINPINNIIGKKISIDKKSNNYEWHNDESFGQLDEEYPVNTKDFSQASSKFWKLKQGQNVHYKTFNNKKLPAEVLGFQNGQGRAVLLKLPKNKVVSVDALTNGEHVI